MLMPENCWLAWASGQAKLDQEFQLGVLSTDSKTRQDSSLLQFIAFLSTSSTFLRVC